MLEVLRKYTIPYLDANYVMQAKKQYRTVKKH